MDPMKSEGKTANQRADEVLKGLAEVVTVKWYRNRSETAKLVVTVRNFCETATTTILVSEGSHDLYDSLKGAV